jgi:hypothetical protein
MHTRTRSGRRLLSIFAFVTTIFAFAAAPIGAQPAPATVNVNSYLCPADYDQVSDCLKIGDVTVSISADGSVIGEVTTIPESSADIEVPVGSNVTIAVGGGAPEGTLEDTALTFIAVEGTNPVTLVFVENAAPVDTDQDGLTDDQEADLGTDPGVYDSDADGVSDGGEVNAGTDPLNPDTDGDGYTDKEELDVNADPLDPASLPTTAEPNSITILAYTCPAGFEGKDLFENCTTPAAGVDFTASLDASEFGVTQATAADGSVTFSGLGSGAYSVHEDLNDLSGPLLRFSFNCFGDPVAPDAPEPRQIEITSLDESGFGLNLTSGEEVTCTWFNIPAGNEAQAPETPAPVAPTTPVVSLPNTGHAPQSPHDSNDAVLFTLVAGMLTCAGVAASMIGRLHR